MTKPVAITGSLVDIKNVNMHKCARLVIDVPSEQAKSIIEAFGWPTMADPIPVAVARLAPPATAKPPPVANPAGGGESRKWDDLPYPAQAGIRCMEAAFQTYVNKRFGVSPTIHIDAANIVREQCSVRSRSELIRGTPAGDRWHSLDLEFQNYLRGDNDQQ